MCPLEEGALHDDVNPPADDPAREVLHRVLNDMVTMAEATLLAYLQTRGTLNCSERQLNTLAMRLGELITVYSVSDDRQTIRALSPADVQDGSFLNGGRLIIFPDRRQPIAGLA